MLNLSPEDLNAIWLSLKLASITTTITLAIGGPLAWWLARGESWSRRFIGALVTMPLILPPTVLGFYLLVGLGPNGPGGKIFEFLNSHTSLNWRTLPFTFQGLVVASVICSMPFVVQPLQNAFEALGERPLEAAATLGASPLDAFLTIIIPQAKPALITAAAMGFAHTIGEFGVVLMIGGNIPEVTRVLSMQIYVYVENSEYARAHVLAGGMVAFSITVLMVVQMLNPRGSRVLRGQK